MSIITKVLDFMRIEEPEEPVHDDRTQTYTSRTRPYTDHTQAVYNTYTRRIQAPYTSRIQPYRATKGHNINDSSAYTKRVGGVCTLLVFIGALSTTALGDSMGEDMVLMTWLLLAVCVVGFDSLGIICRLLSRQARALVCSSLVVSMLAWNEERLIQAAVIICLVTSLVIWFKNRAWLQAENWTLTHTVEQAINRENNATLRGSWLSKGRNESMTMLHEMGYSLTEKDLDSFVYGSWALGYLHGNQSEIKVSSLLNENRALKAQSKELEKMINEMGKPNQSLRDDIKHLEIALNERTEIIKKYELYIKQLERDAMAAAEKLEALEAMQSKPQEGPKEGAQVTIEDPGIGVILVQPTKESIYKRILESSESISKTAEHLNCKHWQVQHTRIAQKLFREGCSIEDVKRKTKLSIEAIAEIQKLTA